MHFAVERNLDQLVCADAVKGCLQSAETKLSLAQQS